MTGLEIPADVLAVRLVHVDTQRLLAERLDSSTEPDPPWMGPTGRQNGLVSIESFDDNHVAGSLEVSMRKGGICAHARLIVLYEVNLDSPVLQKGVTILERVPEPYQKGLAQQCLCDLYPFAREAIHRASAQVLPVEAILMAPEAPELGEGLRMVRSV